MANDKHLIYDMYAEKELLQLLTLGMLPDIADRKEISIDGDVTTIFIAFSDPAATAGDPNIFAFMKKIITIVSATETTIELLFAEGRLKYENPLTAIRTANYIPRKFLY